MLCIGLALVGYSGSIDQVVIDLKSRTAISPYIYGANFPNWEKMGSVYTVARQGGNRMTAYNWETNASNAGNDYRHQNDGYMGESTEPGWTLRTFFQPAQSRGAAVILTVPAAGYVSADKYPSGDVNQTPDFLIKRFFKSYASKPGGKYEFPPNTADRAVYQDEMVAWVEKAKSSKTPVWYSVDNEPDLWHSTHERIVPKNLGFEKFLAVSIDFAKAIKSVAPKAWVFGPASYGWNGFRTFQDAPDKNGRDFLDFYLGEMKKAEAKSGKRILDVLDIHWYPEARGGGKRITEVGNEETELARIQAPRSLWDPTYVEESWISDSLGKKPITLIPRTQQQISKNYPGTKLGITEYNFGGDKTPGGLVAQADVLGIYGRYGVTVACNWGISAEAPSQIAAFQSFLNFDGKGGKFGSVGLGVKGVNNEKSSVYAAVDSNNSKRLTLIYVNKDTVSQTTIISIPGFTAKSLRAFSANIANPFAPQAVSLAKIGGAGVQLTNVPARSVITVELKS